MLIWSSDNYLQINFFFFWNSVHFTGIKFCWASQLMIFMMVCLQYFLKGGGRAKKKKAIGINFCQNGRLAKAKFTLVFWTQALSHN